MVYVQIDIPLTLVLMSIGIIAILLWVAYFTLNYRRFIKLVRSFMGNVPVLAPADMKDMEERARAIDAFNHGDREPLEQYWAKFYREGGEKNENGKDEEESE
jgi:hypothetical protein